MIRGILVMTILAGLVAGCSEGPAGTQTPGSPMTSAPPTAATPSASVSWSSGPVAVEHHPTVPPVPVLLRVRYAAHSTEGFDRIVFDLSGALPGYSVRYVSRVTADPSDKAVTVPGRRHLMVVLHPAQAHRDDGTATVSGIHRLDLPMLRSYAVVGDFEGHISIALGLDDVVGYRVGELPGRIYLDVAS